jgi:hypothetical protein
MHEPRLQQCKLDDTRLNPGCSILFDGYGLPEDRATSGKFRLGILVFFYYSVITVVVTIISLSSVPTGGQDEARKDWVRIALPGHQVQGWVPAGTAAVVDESRCQKS